MIPQDSANKTISPPHTAPYCWILKGVGPEQVLLIVVVATPTANCDNTCFLRLREQNKL